ncbi:unnamed protein product [Hymenolepis diminuta]|uniref:SCP domain-containing protein n=1 Tax=Hymenolepis diminuta TaxID=6216 RepID=A0A564YKT3_HYMDI|nr:unnamed protein product [Hymenolepis diminuta]
MVSALRDVRKNVKPPASAMRYIAGAWSIEGIAKNWAKKCQFRRPTSKDPSEIQPYAVAYKVSRTDLPVKEVVKKWANEGMLYNYKNNTCKISGFCDNYKIITADISTQVGCAKQLCGYKYLWVCIFKPKRDLSERPYVTGGTCSACPSNFHCEDKLCKFGPGPKKNTCSKRLKF